MRRLFLAGDGGDLDVLESRPFEPLRQLAFGKPQPAVAVDFAGGFELVLEQIQDDDLTRRAQDAPRAAKRLGRILGVMQGLAEDVDADGALLVRTEGGSLEKVLVGDVTLRGQRITN